MPEKGLLCEHGRHRDCSPHPGARLTAWARAGRRVGSVDGAERSVEKVQDRQLARRRARKERERLAALCVRNNCHRKGIVS